MIHTRIATAMALLALLALTGALVSGAPPQQMAAPWAEWVEPDFPFFSSVIDAGRAGPSFPARNITPRGLVLNLGRGYWVGFDTDLLRVAVVWQGKGVSPRALAPGSYLQPDRKTPGGQSPLPEPDGTVWAANGIYPGWQNGERPTFEDPREPAPTVSEIGRGPVSGSLGRFTAVRLTSGGAVLEYAVRGADVREWISAARDASTAVVRRISIGPSAETLWLMLGFKGAGAVMTGCSAAGTPVTVESMSGPAGDPGPVWVAKVPAHSAPLQFCVAIGPAQRATGDAIATESIPTTPPPVRWPQSITTSVTLSTARDAYVVDDFTLPTANPWRRNVRPGDIQFLEDGTGVLVTLDGDVWTARGLAWLPPSRGSSAITWRRFTSGLHEPLTLAIRDGQIHVFDRNGIWRIRDTNGDGEADVHELFSNAFAQTADMREFPSTIRLAPNGEFVIAKGGQEAATIGKHNGSVLRVSADGRSSTVLGYGFRQPQIGVNVRTGLVTASDQQGHYIPSTPLHVVRDHQFYGFLSDKLPREAYPAPIAEPLTWIPHAVNASAMSQVWLFNARMGPLDDQMVHIGFNRPELFRVMLNTRAARPQAAVASITTAFQFPPLNGSVNPQDGQLYIAGFQVLGWGTTSARLGGLGRVRYTGAPSTLPAAVVPMDKGILLRFDSPLDAGRAGNPHNYTVAAWHYKRTYMYGSPQLKADETPGSDRLVASSAYVSKDGRSVFVGIPGLKPVMQMRIGWTLATASGTIFQDSASFTPYELTPFDPVKEGFAPLTVDLSPRTEVADAVAPVSADEGRKIYERFGCVACHANDANAVSKLGPNFRGLFGSERTFNEGTVRVTADEAYIRESILEPTRKVVSGFNRIGMGMPSFAGVLTDEQVQSVILYIKSLK